MSGKHKWAPVLVANKTYLCGESNKAWSAFDEPEEDMGTTVYIHRDAARAWQHVRDWLNGSPEEWKAFITRCVLLAAELGAGTKGNLYGQRDD